MNFRKKLSCRQVKHKLKRGR